MDWYVLKTLKDTSDSVEFSWDLGSVAVLVQARGKVLGGDFNQGPSITEFRMSVFPLDRAGHLIEADNGFKELSVFDVGKDDWNAMESYAETLLFEDFRERGCCA